MRAGGRKKLILLAGNFGIGKTSIVNFHGVKKTDDELIVEVDGWVSLGGVNGVDSLSGMRKVKALSVLLNKVKEQNVIVHGCFYQARVDLLRYSKYHDVSVVVLDTSFKENAKRIRGRGKEINRVTFRTELGKVMRIVEYSQVLGIACYHIDNNRSLEEVAVDFWALAEKIKNG